MPMVPLMVVMVLGMTVIGSRGIIRGRGIVVVGVMGVSRWPIVAIWIGMGTVTVVEKPGGNCPECNPRNDPTGVACLS